MPFGDGSAVVDAIVILIEYRYRVPGSFGKHLPSELWLWSREPRLPVESSNESLAHSPRGAVSSLKATMSAGTSRVPWETARFTSSAYSAGGSGT